MDTLVRNWWWIALRGIAALYFGVAVFALPQVSIAALLLLFWLYVLVDGIFSLAAALRSRGGRRPSWNRVVHGIAGIGAGILMFFIPRITALILVYLIAVWSLITGFLQIAAAVRLRRVIPGEGWMILAGLVSVGFGMLLAFLPAPEGTALVFWIAAFALVLGAMLVALAFRLRRHGQELPV